jgi:iron complex transport system substrate-binding protein
MGEENSIPVESIIRSKSELLIYSGFGKAFPFQEQLEKLGTICLANYDWKENHPLGKAEWIKVFGYLTGKDNSASIYFNRVEKDYLRLKKIASKLKSTPTLFSGNLVGDIWYSPAGESYNAILFKDAKGAYKYAQTSGTGSTENSFEQIFSENVNTEYWLNPGVVSKKELLNNQPKFKLFQAYKNNKIFSFTFSGNEFWERSAIEPNHVLSDLIRILHPELKLKNKLYFYRTLSK